MNKLRTPKRLRKELGWPIQAGKIPYNPETGPNRILPREAFFHLLDLEVKRSRRYQNFFSVLSPDELPDHDIEMEIQACLGKLTRLLAEEMRDSDILGALGEKRLAVILPYADLMAGGNTRSRFESSLQFCDFSRDGFRVVIDQVCFPGWDGHFRPGPEGRGNRNLTPKTGADMKKTIIIIGVIWAVAVRPLSPGELTPRNKKRPFPRSRRRPKSRPTAAST